MAVFSVSYDAGGFRVLESHLLDNVAHAAPPSDINDPVQSVRKRVSNK